MISLGLTEYRHETPTDYTSAHLALFYARAVLGAAPDVAIVEAAVSMIARTVGDAQVDGTASLPRSLLELAARELLLRGEFAAWLKQSPESMRRTRPTMDLLPPVLSDHLDLPEHLTLGVDHRRSRRHPAPPLSYRGEEFSVTTGGDYWVTGDNDHQDRRQPKRHQHRGHHDRPAAPCEEGSLERGR